MPKATYNITLFLIVTTILILLLAGFVIAILLLYRRNQISYRKILEQIKLEHEQNLLSTQIEIQENTFQHISREIHDNINLELTLAKLNLNTFDWTCEDRAREQLCASLDQISKAIIDLSDISKSLSSDIIVSQGLIRALEKELSKIRRTNFFEVRFLIEGDPVFMDSNKELVIFRIVQEAFNNIIKHAEATVAELRLNYSENSVDVCISDNGKGFSRDFLNESPDKYSKAGLGNIQKRAAMFNGKTTIESKCGEGTNILISIPY